MTVQILVVDDEMDIPRMIRDYLEDVTEYKVDIAPSGEAALEMCSRLHPQLCIVDMRLPDMTGNEFILAAHGKVPGCKFIIHTGSLDYTIPAELLEIGLNDEAILFKPVLSLANFVEKIQQLLGL